MNNSISRYYINIEDSINKINKINNNRIKTLQQSYFYKGKEKDSRYVILTLLHNELQNFMLSMMLAKQINDNSFWESNEIKTSPSDENKEKVLESYLNSSSNSFFFLYFVQLENYLRLIAHNIGKEKRSITQTFKELVNEYSLSKDSQDLFEIVVNVRNSCHNGGFYSGTTKTINYKNETYDFNDGIIVQYNKSNIQGNIYLAEEIINLIEELNCKTHKISFIEHNYSNINHIDAK